MKRLVMVVILLAGGSCAWADVTVENEVPIRLNGEIRHRLEADDKDFSSAADSGLSTIDLLRTRVSLSIAPTEDLIFFTQLQDARKFGTETDTTNPVVPGADPLDMHQAYLQIANFFKSGIDLKLGRLELSYGNERLIGSVGWSNIGRSFDGAVVRLARPRVWVDLIGVTVKENGLDGDAGDRYFVGVWGNISGLAVAPDIFLLLDTDDHAGALSRYTTGFHLTGTRGALGHELEFAYQGGDYLGRAVSALMAAGNVAYQLSTELKPVLKLGLAYLSGDDDSTDGKQTVFDTLFAANHKFYGYMDFFTDIPTHTQQLGLVDVHTTIGVSCSDQTALTADYHYFLSAKESSAGAHRFGHEIDFSLTHHYNPRLSFLVGVDLFVPGDLIKQQVGIDPRVSGRDSASFGYVQTTLKL